MSIQMSMSISKLKSILSFNISNKIYSYVTTYLSFPSMLMYVENHYK